MVIAGSWDGEIASRNRREAMVGSLLLHSQRFAVAFVHPAMTAAAAPNAVAEVQSKRCASARAASSQPARLGGWNTHLWLREVSRGGGGRGCHRFSRPLIENG